MIDLYREEILEHWQNPLNYGKLKGADFVIEQVNPLCGDQVTFYFKLGNKRHVTSNTKKKDKRIMSDVLRVTDVCFVGSGCAISIAAASMLSEAIKGKSVSALSKITGKDVLKLIGGSIAPARLKCAFLSLEALRKLRVNS